MRSKLHSYLGFAKKSGNLISGYHTCISTMKKGRIHLLLVAEDISDHTEEKIMREANNRGVPWRQYGSSRELSQVTGAVGRSIFGIMDQNFAQAIQKEIDGQGEIKKEALQYENT